MPIRVTKLKLTHMFISSRRLAKKLLHQERDERTIKAAAKAQLEDLNDVIVVGYPDEIVSKLKIFFDEVEKYLKVVVFSIEEDVELLLLRVEEDFENENSFILKDEEACKAHGLDDERLATAWKVAEKEATVMLNKALEASKTLYKEVRSQDRDHMRMREELKAAFALKGVAGFNEIHAIKDLKRRLKAEKDFERKDEDILDAIKKAVSSKKGVEEAEVVKLLQELDTTLSEEDEIANKLIDYLVYINGYAMRHYFQIKNMQEIGEGVIAKLHKSDGLYASTYKELTSMVQRLETWEGRSAHNLRKLFRQERRMIKRDN